MLRPPEEFSTGSKKVPTTYSPTDCPSASPALMSKLQWNPAQIRLSPASCAAALKLSNERVTPGRPTQEKLNGIASGPKKEASTAAPLPRMQGWAAGWEAGPGGARSGGQ